MNYLKQCYNLLNKWVEGDELPTHEKTEKLRKYKRKHHTVFQILNSPYVKTNRIIFDIVCILVCVVFSAIMLHVVSQLPSYNSEVTPTNNELSERYIEHGIEDVGATNLITNVILVYRGFDTFGESCVLFLAATAIIILLRRDKNNNTAKDDEIRLEDAQIEEQESCLVLRNGVKFFMPLILLFGFYVLFNGHISPGGGFAGGAIIGAALILYDNAFGANAVEKFFDDHLYHIIKIGALIIYGILICYTIFVGANGIENIIPHGTPGSIFSGGITLPINIVVGLEVACTMYAFYAYFSKGEL